MNLLDEEGMLLQAQQLDGFADYLADQVAKKRLQPQNDMISELTQVKYKALLRLEAREYFAEKAQPLGAQRHRSWLKLFR